MIVAKRIAIAKAALFSASLIPLAVLGARIVGDDLGANPIETLNRFTGDWTLRFVLITLAVTPVRQIFGWHTLIRFRRMLGLFAFFYASLHFLSYAWIDQFFDLNEIFKDVAKRPFITIGFASFLMLIPLALTSTNTMVRRLGKRWRPLHRLVYAIAIGGVVHYFWLVKSDLREPLLYAAILAMLLGYRVWHWRRKAGAVPLRAATSGGA